MKSNIGCSLSIFPSLENNAFQHIRESSWRRWSRAMKAGCSSCGGRLLCTMEMPSRHGHDRSWLGGVLFYSFIWFLHYSSRCDSKAIKNVKKISNHTWHAACILLCAHVFLLWPTWLQIEHLICTPFLDNVWPLGPASLMSALLLCFGLPGCFFANGG